MMFIWDDSSGRRLFLFFESYSDWVALGGKRFISDAFPHGWSVIVAIAGLSFHLAGPNGDYRK